MSNKTRMQEFEDTLRTECEEHLKDSFDVDHYVNVTLDSMYYGGDNPRYMGEDGNEYHFEIPARDSKDNRPHTVSA